MDLALVRAIEELGSFSVAKLKVKYRELLGAETACWHKQFLVRRIAWQLQAQVEGGLSRRASLRAAQIADDADLRVRGPQGHWRWPCPDRGASGLAPSLPLDTRLPEPGTRLTRQYQGRMLRVQVLEHGFEFESRHYRSLSAIAREVTGTRWNGLLFFGLAERRRG